MKGAWKKTAAKPVAKKRVYKKARVDLTLEAQPASIVKRNKIGNNYVVYHAPNLSPLPAQWVSKFRTKALFSIGTAGFSSAGVFKTSLVANSTFNLLDAVLTTSGVTINDGGAATRAPIGIATLLGTDGYLTYQVLACRVKLRVMPLYTTDQMMVGICPSTVTTASFDWSQMATAPFSKAKTCNLYSSGEDNTLTCYVDFAKFFGIPSKVFNADQSGNWSGVHGALPADQLNFIIYLQTMDGAITTGITGVEIEVEQTIRLYGLDNGLLA